MISLEQKRQFSEILDDLGSTLDLTEQQYNDAIKSYESVGKVLSSETSQLSIFEPDILPQGSFLLGTVIKPVDGDIDLDLVCKLNGKRPDWTQYDLKQIVGNVLRNSSYAGKLDKEKQRCWTLQYSESRNFHMDILPSIVNQGYKEILEKSLRSYSYENIDALAIRITDNLDEYYSIESNPELWPKSNPFGYAKWFQNQANLTLRKSALLMERKLQPVPSYEQNKLPLQRLVQILKRHRDLMFEGRDHKPISIIITTLAGLAYQKEEDLTDALLGFISRAKNFIRLRYSDEYGREIYWLPNPINELENFADKWPDERIKQDNFFEWLDKVERDINFALAQGQGLPNISKALENPFGKEVIGETFEKYGKRNFNKRVIGTQKMAPVTGMLGSEGKKVKDHHFFGGDEK